MADLSAGVPAFFLSISEGRQEALLSVRGTFSPEDVFTDLLATGERGRYGWGGGGWGEVGENLEWWVCAPCISTARQVRYVGQVEWE